MNQLTPREIVRELDRYIVGQEDAKRAVAVALRNRYRRAQLPREMQEEVTPKNILMVGPTGVGKTEIARRLAKLVDAPFVKVEATKFTEVGYVGRDVETIIRDLVETSIRLTKEIHQARVHVKACERAEVRLADLIIQPTAKKAPNPIDVLLGNKPRTPELPAEEQAQLSKKRGEVIAQLRSGELEHRLVEIEVEESTPHNEIPGTDVNYPVVQHPTDDTFYLKHNKDGEWSEEGAIYTQLANKTDFSDPVTVVYGHNLVQGTMFTTLHRFENKDFFDSHEDMYLYTDGHILTYRVIAAYQYDNRHILNSFNFSDPTIVQQYFDSVLSPDSLVENVREGTTLTSSDKIVQLSTCTGDSNHIVRRYLVTGVLVSDQPTY